MGDDAGERRFPLVIAVERPPGGMSEEELDHTTDRQLLGCEMAVILCMNQLPDGGMGSELFAINKDGTAMPQPWIYGAWVLLADKVAHLEGATPLQRMFARKVFEEAGKLQKGPRGKR